MFATRQTTLGLESIVGRAYDDWPTAGVGEIGMRTSLWACIFTGVLTCLIAYQHFGHASSPLIPSEPIEQYSLDQTPEQSLPIKDGSPSQEVDGLEAGHLPLAQNLDDTTGTTASSELNQANKSLSYLAYYVYSELPPEIKPADTVLNYLKGIPAGQPVDEVKRVADVLGLDFNFMKTVAKIESGFNPKQRTGSYVGLFQLSEYEFKKYGTGDILASRDNTVAAALKIMTEATLFEILTRRKPTMNDLYLIHQQGIEGAAEHLRQPNRLAWQSMCATEEGKQKGEKWCKRAIWGNTLPAIKHIWKTVNKVTSGEFVEMWQQRASQFYARYSQTAAN